MMAAGTRLVLNQVLIIGEGDCVNWRETWVCRGPLSRKRHEGARFVGEKVVIFANPIAGRGKGRVLAEALAARFRAEAWEACEVYDRPDGVSETTLAGM